ncbi:uncharacterized protein [Ptychodera flava]|uniref:uncharacterized protein n=1 Tax=Ptychodera flava TaxID=63121 RepID=UPI00396A01F2
MAAVITLVRQGFLLIFIATAAHAVYCPGYTDYTGVQHNGFDCPKFDDKNDQIYCCKFPYMTTADRYCCDYYEHQRYGFNSTIYESDYGIDYVVNDTVYVHSEGEAVSTVGFGVPAILGLALGGLFLIVVIVVVVAMFICFYMSDTRRNDTRPIIHYQAVQQMTAVPYTTNSDVINPSTNQLPPAQAQGVAYQHPDSAHYTTQQPVVSQNDIPTNSV